MTHTDTPSTSARRPLLVGLGALLLFLAVAPAHAGLPGSFTHRTRYIEADGSYSYWTSGTETYVRETLPNEWYASWSNATLDAGAVIIRSGVYWRVNRSILLSSWPNNNCYLVSVGSSYYYRTAPVSRGGQEQWIPFSGVASTNDATTRTNRYHAERTSTPSGRPDRFVGLRYNSTIQNSTNSASGGWLSKVQYAYVGSGIGAPFDPNQECSQSDSQSYAEPTYINY